MLRALRVVARVHLRRLAAQWVRAVLAVAAVAAGTSLAVGVVVVLSSTDASLAAVGRALAGPAPLRVVGAVADGGVPPRVVREVRATPGVAVALPVVQVGTVVRAASGADVGVALIGVGCGAADPAGVPPCPAQTAGGAVVGTSLARLLGPASWVQTDQGVLPLGDVRPDPALDRLAGGMVVVTSLPTAQVLYDRGTNVDVVYVTLRSLADIGAVQGALARRVGPAFAVLQASQPPAVVGLATSSFVPLLGLVAILAAGIAAVLVYDVVALSLEEQRRQHALLAAVGAPPWLLAAGPAVEVAAIGVVGGLLGVGGGAALAGPVLAPLSTFTEAIFGVGLTVHPSVGDVVLGAVFGLVVGLAAAVRPMRRMATFDMAGELHDRSRRIDTAPRVSWRRAAIGGIAVLLGGVMAYAGSRHGALAGWQLPTAEVGFLLAVAAGTVVVGAGSAGALGAIGRSVAVAGAAGRGPDGRSAGPGALGALGPSSEPLVGAAAPDGASAAPGQPSAGRAPRRMGAGWRQGSALVRLGAVSAGREPGRMAVMAVAVAAAVAVGTVTAGYRAGLTASVTASGGRSTAGQGIIVDTVAGVTGDDPDAHVPADAVDEIDRVPGVGQVDQYVSVLTGSTPGSLALVTAADSPRGGPSLVAGRAAPGPFRRGAVMVGVGLARSRGVRPGDLLPLDTTRGIVRVPVEGIWNDGAVNGDNVTMSLPELTRIFGAQLPISLTVFPAPGVTTATVLHRLRTLPLAPDVTLTVPTAYRRQQAAQLTGQLAPFETLERALLVVAFVGVLATLLLVGAGRRREMAVLQAVGTSPGGVAAVVVVEAVLAAVAGAVGGVVLGAAVLEVLVLLAPLVDGFAVPYRFAAGVLVTVVPLVVVLAAVAAVVPAWQAARGSVADGLRAE